MQRILWVEKDEFGIGEPLRFHCTVHFETEAAISMVSHRVMGEGDSRGPINNAAYIISG